MIPKKINDKRRVRYEFFIYSGAAGVLSTQINLKIENPASVKFINVGPAPTVALINNVIFLSSCLNYVGGTAVGPFELELKNNLNEIDVTNYSLKIFGAGVVQVICKYYVNE
jgi:hypothetical protein